MKWKHFKNYVEKNLKIDPESEVEINVSVDAKPNDLCVVGIGPGDGDTWGTVLIHDI